MTSLGAKSGGTDAAMLIDPDTQEVFTLADVQRWQREALALKDLLVTEKRRDRAKIQALQKEIDDLTGCDAETSEMAEEVFAWWNAECRDGKAKLSAFKKHSSAKRKAVVARINDGRTMEEFRLAIHGAKTRPFVKNGEAYDDLSLICRSDEKFESFMARGRAARATENRVCMEWEQGYRRGVPVELLAEAYLGVRELLVRAGLDVAGRGPYRVVQELVEERAARFGRGVVVPFRRRGESVADAS
jgi:hypothetical protein